MGFDAIWITPVVDNYDGGYHGYWARNMYGTNSNFGSSEDLKRFVNICHSRDIWVMVDIVANHVYILILLYRWVIPILITLRIIHSINHLITMIGVIFQIMIFLLTILTILKDAD